MKVFMKVFLKSSLSLLLMIISTGIAMAEDNVTNALNKYAWDKRQIIVFSPNENHPEYIKLKQTISQHLPELKERKLHIWHVVEDTEVRLGNTLINNFTNQEIRQTFAVNKDEFRMILIAYDQGEKLRLSQTNLSYIFSKIDQMPMRIQEMQQTN